MPKQHRSSPYQQDRRQDHSTMQRSTSIAAAPHVSSRSVWAGSPVRPRAQGYQAHRRSITEGIDPTLLGGLIVAIDRTGARWSIAGRRGQQRADRSSTTSAQRAEGCGRQPTAVSPGARSPTSSSRLRRSAPSRSPNPTRTSCMSGMGETELRGNIIQGDGVYKSTDGGKTFTHVGLEKTLADLTHPRSSNQSGHRVRRSPR